MCGRFSLYALPDDIARIFAVLPSDSKRVLDAGPRYNVAPTTDVVVVRQSAKSENRELALLRWGLIPHWAKNSGEGPLLINARGETVADKPAFRSSFRYRRCLVIADGFYEWQKLHDRKQPYHFRVNDGAPFAFAGIWDRLELNEGGSVESCAIITTRANELTGLVHDRMPLILGPDSWETWMSPGSDERTQRMSLQSLLCPYPADSMTVYPVSTLVNSPKNDVPDCVEPIGPALQVGGAEC